MKCTFCHAPWHPATGAYYGPRTRACYRCVTEFWTWFRRRLKSKPRGGGPSFYDHVVWEQK